jgi:hypothetical protein
MRELSEKQWKNIHRAEENCKRILKDQLGVDVDVKITIRAR